MPLELRPLSPHTGIEATGIDLRQPQSVANTQRLNAAVVEHVALVVRNQQLDAPTFLSAMRLFGEPMEQNFTAYRHPDELLVNLISNTFEARDGRRVFHSNYWHTDHTNRERPPSYTALHPVELPESGGGDTSIVNMRAAYQGLSPEMKVKIDRLRTVNVFQGSASPRKSHRYKVSGRSIADRPVVHPLVRTHPINGTRAIYMHQGKVEKFEGMNPADSQTLIEELLACAIRPDYIYRHRWQPGDVLIWDDRSTMHKAMADYDLTETRTLYRVLIQGDRPV